MTVAGRAIPEQGVAGLVFNAKELIMLSQSCLHELSHTWLPHVTEAGLDRLIELLEQASPLLIHGSFTRAVPMGCLATHIAWHHPRTRHLTVEAGISWLTTVACLNPATSQVIREWDGCGSANWEVRAELLAVLKEYRRTRTMQPDAPSCEPALATV
jgi:hypothetical protein